MSSLKLKHSGGNSVSLNPPTSAPTSTEVAFKLPNADGSANKLLKTDGSGNLGWATDQGGKILQVVPNTQTFTSNTTTTSSSFVNLTSTLNTSITPSSSSSKIFVIMSAPIYAANTFNGGIASFAIGRNGSTINGDDYSYGDMYQNASGTHYTNLTMSILDSPNTDQQVTYNFMCRTNSTSYAVGVGAYGRNEVVSITLFEVGG